MENWDGGFLYRYREWNDYTKKLLLDGEFFYAEFHNLNDPNEGKNISDELIKKTIRDHLIPTEKNSSIRTYMENELKEWDKKPAIGKRYKKELKTFISNMGLVCLTTKPDNNPMWHFYAAGNTGICIEFYFPVEYSNQYKHLCPCPISYESIPITYNDLAEILVFNKDSDWRYENEYRLIERDLKDSNQRIKKFPVEKMLCSVIAGHNMSNDDLVDLKKVIKDVNKKYNLKVTIHRRINREYGPIGVESEDKWKKRLKGLKHTKSKKLE